MGFKDKLKDGINKAGDIAQSGIESTKKFTEGREEQKEIRLQEKKNNELDKNDEDELVPTKYVVLQVTLKEKLIGTSSRNLGELERVINKQAAKGFRLHTISTVSANSTGLGGGDRIQATMVFERI